ncbi:MAG: DNA gyrase subunit A [Oscillospiraceae bacterium]|jgi:DNA gyrase subunit A|nr:DNA gyrase subunit A [Oscillospiraceae bacterium]
MSKQNEQDREPVSFENQKLLPVELESEMRRSFIEYSMSVITSRALPDVRDGLKPVHRRILYTMYEENLTPDKAFRKSATAVGDVMGRYHPHGDASIYDALVRMAQPFSLRHMLIDGHGNFGSVDDDPPAAMRYTEARLSRTAMEMMADIDKETVDFNPNYDNFRQEPAVLPSLFPNLLVNGSSGIAVGMATNIPPHNLREVAGAILCELDNPDAGLDELMEHLHGPDFPTAAQIFGRAGIRAAYAGGRGRIRVRARAEIEEYKGKTRIVVTELPYQVNKARLVEHIGVLARDKLIEGVAALRDESGRGGMKIVLDLKRDANAQVTLNKLYAQTNMQVTFAINMIALVNGQPMTLGLKPILGHYIAHRKEVVRRRTEYDLRKARERMHILEGLRIAVDNIDEAIRIIRASYNNAKQRLMERFDLSDIQGQAIVDMRLGRLQGLEIEKLQAEMDELAAKITDYLDILADEERVKNILREELTALADKFGDDRRTEIIENDDEIDLEDLIEREDCVYTLTHVGYIKRAPKAGYRSQRRGGRGVTAQTVREEDYVEELFIASTHDDLYFFTSKGRLFKKRGYTVPEAGRSAKGMNLANLLPLEQEEKVSAVIPVRGDEDVGYLFMATKNGVVKRASMDKFASAGRKAGLIALTIEDGDELIAVRKTDGKQDMLLATREGQVICFAEDEVRDMGRSARGVTGIRLLPGDYVIGAARARQGAELLTVTEKGYGKRTPVGEYKRGGEAQHRGGKGLRNQTLNVKTGKVAGIRVVDEEDDVLLISNDGTIIRMAVAGIRLCSRTAQGVILMRTGGDARVIALARTFKEEAEETALSDGEPMADAPSGDPSGSGPPEEA